MSDNKTYPLTKTEIEYLANAISELDGHCHGEEIKAIISESHQILERALGQDDASVYSTC